ncbi:unnamed protein product, partial [Discosporangium mesarthrocarpum]
MRMKACGGSSAAQAGRQCTGTTRNPVEDRLAEPVNYGSCLKHVARCRRLNKEEIVDVLSNPRKYGLSRTSILPEEGVRSGTIFLCAKEHVTSLKKDGISYVKRSTATDHGRNRVREDRVKLKVDGRHAINTYSSRGMECSSFWRRRYSLEPYTSDPLAQPHRMPAPTPARLEGGAEAGVGAGLGVGGDAEADTEPAGTGGDHLIHYLDEDKAKRLAMLSPFGASGVAESLTNRDVWSVREQKLPPDGGCFLPAPLLGWVGSGSL